MGDDSFAFGQTSGLASATGLNCTANDIDVATTDITRYSFDGTNFTPLAPGARVDCVQGDTIFVETVAHLQNNATARYDIGIWIAASETNDTVAFSNGRLSNAVTGSCTHYNLTKDSAGVANLDGGDACGDMSSGGLTALKLDVLKVACKPDQDGNVSVGSCIGWQNQVGGAVRVCPTPGSPQTYRFGTTPDNKAKCNCSPMVLPINLKGILRVKKTTIPSGDATAFTFTPTGWNSGATFTRSDVQGTFDSEPLSAATYSVAETLNGDYDLTGRACVVTGTNTAATFSTVGNNGVSVALAAGQDVTCTFTNTKKPKLTLAKHVINNNGGTANASQWTLTATGTGGFTGNGSPATGVDASLGPNVVNIGVQYTLSESGGPSGYTQASAWVCTGGGTFVTPDKITLAAGDNVTCTINNDDIGPQLTLVKQVINDNGGTANASQWTLTATGSGGFSGTGSPATGPTATLGPNGVTANVQYVLSESGGPSGYTAAAAWVCAGGGTFVSPDKITLGVGENATCTITNNDIAPQLTLAKHVINNNGGTANASQWTLTATGAGGFSGTGLPATGVDASIGPNAVTANVQYTLSESGGPSGYTSTGVWVCVGGTFVAPDKITLGSGQSATCTITNDDVAPQLTLAKHVINNNGGTANASQWTLTAAGAGGFSGTGLPATGVDASIGPNGVTAGVQYTLSESGGPSGYTSTGVWVCVGGTFVSPDKITLGSGQSATCTITNDDVAPQLTLAKHVINNNGGTANASEWTLTATGSGGFSGTGSPATGADASLGPTAVTANVQYTLSESGGPSGYTSTGVWVCVGGTFVAPDKITLGSGGSATCTITNDDVGPQLTLAKHVINNNGGTANASQWTLTATGSGGFSGTGLPATGPDASLSQSVTANVQYTLSESNGPSGYTSTGVWVCVGGTFVSPDKITLGVGQSATCTIVNDDVAPQLTLAKHVINNNGGTANASEWTLTATGSGGFSGNGSPATGADASLGPTAVTANVQYTLSESGGPSGYTSTGVWVCVGGTFVSPDKITLGSGGSATCTITNDDVGPQLTLVKQVVNDNGGTANASQWTLTATGSGGFSGTGSPATGPAATLGPTGVTANVQYVLSESGGPSGYTSTGVWVCVGGTFVSPDKITLGVGGSATCTITNDDIAPQLTLAKHVINNSGGTANASQWTLTATGSGGFSGNGSPATGTDASLGPNAVTAGVQYVLSESGGPSDYTAASAWVCTGDGSFVSPDKITLAVGQSATCTITNDDNPRGTAAITPTQTTCQDFVAGTFTPEPGIFAGIKNGVINNVSPGVFFFYSNVTVPAGGGTITVQQTVIPGAVTLPPYQLLQGQAFLYSASCVKIATFALDDAGGGTVSAAAGSYIVGFKYSPSAAVGFTTGAQSSGTLLSTHQYQVVGSGLSASIQTKAK